MNFIEAVKLAKEGKKIRSVNWYKGDYIYVRHDGLIDESDNKYSPGISDILINDWEIYEEEPKTYSFQEVFKAYNEGNKISRLNKCWWLLRNNSNDYDSHFSYDDIVANDWVIKKDVEVTEV